MSPAGDPAALPALPDITLALKPLSRGPFAAIYRGWDRVHRCDVIVKVQRATGDLIAAERFRREAAVMKRLRHPNIVALYQFHDGDPAALVLEYVPGRTLAALVEAEGWLTPLRTAQVVEDVAAALDCAHAQGIIHRDVKPSNILLGERGAARLFDFGVAHIDEEAPLTVMGDILGTIEYASPEQVHGNETPDARSDVYSLAAVAYFALTCTPPFRAADNSTQAQLSVMHRQVFSDPPALRFHREDLPLVVEAAILRGLAKAPASRYLSAGQFAAALRVAVEAGAGVPELRAMAVASRRAGALAGALAGATLLLLGALALWRTGEFTSPHSARAAQVGQTTNQTAPEAAALSTVAPNPPVPNPPVPNPVAVVRAPGPRMAVALRPARETDLAAPPRPDLLRMAGRPVPARFVPAHSKPARRLTASVSPRVHPEPLLAPMHPEPYPMRAPSPLVARSEAAAKPPPGRAWLSVYTEQSLMLPGAGEHIGSVKAQSVWVDGYRASDLARGRWASLAAGRHVVSFIPDPKSGFGPRQNIVVKLTPGAHVRKQILLPFSPGADSSGADGLPAAVPLGPGRPSKPPVPLSPAASVPRPVGWYTVSGWISVGAPGHKPLPVRASAQWVKVDGQPVPALALGRWARLPAGKHAVTFQPTPVLGASPKTWDIDLTPQARLSQKIPFLIAPAPTTGPVPVSIGRLLVSGWLSVAPPGRNPQRVPVAAKWVKIDGKPSPDLARGLWVSLPAGRHVLVFQPWPGSGADRATRTISLSPQARLNQLMPLPAAPPPVTPLHLRNP